MSGSVDLSGGWAMTGGEVITLDLAWTRQDWARRAASSQALLQELFTGSALSPDTRGALTTRRATKNP